LAVGVRYHASLQLLDAVSIQSRLLEIEFPRCLAHALLDFREIFFHLLRHNVNRAFVQHQEALAVAHGLPEEAQAKHRRGLKREKRFRSSGGELRAVAVDFDRHQRVVGRVVVQFFSIRSPLRKESSARRDALPGAGLRKRLDNLEPSLLFRLYTKRGYVGPVRPNAVENVPSIRKELRPVSAVLLLSFI
jgi:hypothetical protein